VNQVLEDIRINAMGWGGLYSDIANGMPHMNYFREKKEKEARRQQQLKEQEEAALRAQQAASAGEGEL